MRPPPVRLIKFPEPWRRNFRRLIPCFGPPLLTSCWSHFLLTIGLPLFQSPFQNSPPPIRYRFTHAVSNSFSVSFRIGRKGPISFPFFGKVPPERPLFVESQHLFFFNACSPWFLGRLKSFPLPAFSLPQSFYPFSSTNSKTLLFKWWKEFVDLKRSKASSIPDLFAIHAFSFSEPPPPPRSLSHGLP